MANLYPKLNMPEVNCNCIFYFFEQGKRVLCMNTFLFRKLDSWDGSKAQTESLKRWLKKVKLNVPFIDNSSLHSSEKCLRLSLKTNTFY